MGKGNIGSVNYNGTWTRESKIGNTTLFGMG